jgi:hypothetical protein
MAGYREPIDPNVAVGDIVMVTGPRAAGRKDCRAIISAVTQFGPERPLYHGNFVRGRTPVTLYRSEFDTMPEAL